MVAKAMEDREKLAKSEVSDTELESCLQATTTVVPSRHMNYLAEI